MQERKRAGQSLTERIEQRIQREAGLVVTVDQRDRVISLTGLVDSEEARQAAEDIARAAATSHWIENNLEVQEVFPFPASDLALPARTSEEEDDLVGEEIELLGGELEPDFTDEEPLHDPMAAIGPSSSMDDEVGEGDGVYVPPTDPVISLDEWGNPRVLGGFSPTSEDVEVGRSALDGAPGDEALRDAILTELHEEAATTAFDISVHVRNGIAYLRGRVADLDDAEAVEEVAHRVPGVKDVLEDLEVAGL
jgi:osmotically-inducible protein OsmY